MITATITITITITNDNDNNNNYIYIYIYILKQLYRDPHITSRYFMLPHRALCIEGLVFGLGLGTLSNGYTITG